MVAILHRMEKREKGCDLHLLLPINQSLKWFMILFSAGEREKEREPRLRCFNLSKNNSVVASFVIFPRRTRGNAFGGMMKREIN